jgi:hypothetical protein
MIRRLLAVSVIGSALSVGSAIAEPFGEANELSPEERDAAFTAEDAARMAAGFSDEAVVQASINPFDAMTDAADFVFVGTVVDQTYSYNAAGIPSTHTIFVINEELKGNYPSTQLTLIQPGGPSLSGDRGVIYSTTKYFRVGDEELLFINLDPDNAQEHNRVSVSSRFPIYEGKVYNEDGYGIVSTSSGDLTLSSDRNPSEHFSLIDMGTHTLTRNFVTDNRNPDGDGSGGRRPTPSYTESLDLDSVAEMIAR